MFMEVAAMFLHNARSGACPGWVINGCNNVETKKINAVFSRHIDYEQDADSTNGVSLGLMIAGFRFIGLLGNVVFMEP